jgi:hypothetical protein
MGYKPVITTLTDVRNLIRLHPKSKTVNLHYLTCGAGAMLKLILKQKGIEEITFGELRKII